MLLSRVADSLYWISRYLERAEHTARLIDVRLDLGLDRRRGDDAWEFDRLYAALRLAPPDDVAALGPAALVDALMFDPSNRDSVLSCVTSRARERAPGARGDQLGHVGADERALPAHQAGAPRAHRAGPAALPVARGDRRRPPLRRRHRCDDGPRRRLAVPAGGPLSSSAPARPPRWSTCTCKTGAGGGRRARPNGSACCARARRSRRTAAATPPISGRAGSSSSCC